MAGDCAMKQRWKDR